MVSVRRSAGAVTSPAHTFLADPALIAMEPAVGGRFYERGAGCAQITRGTILEREPPRRLVVTWRIGPGWRPVFDDEQATQIEFEFRPSGAVTEVVATCTQLHRAGQFAATRKPLVHPLSCPEGARHSAPPSA